MQLSKVHVLKRIGLPLRSFPKATKRLIELFMDVLPPEMLKSNSITSIAKQSVKIPATFTRVFQTGELRPRDV